MQCEREGQYRILLILRCLSKQKPALQLTLKHIKIIIPLIIVTYIPKFLFYIHHCLNMLTIEVHLIINIR